MDRSGRGSAIAELEKSFREAQKRLEAEGARVVEDVKDRALRAQLEKQTGRRMGKFESDARAESGCCRRPKRSQHRGGWAWR